jgi:hypothetical protein
MGSPAPYPTGYERLLTETELVDALGLHDRPNPRGAVRWLLRTKQLACVRIGRGIIRFRPADVEAFIRARHERAR